MILVFLRFDHYHVEENPPVTGGTTTTNNLVESSLSGWAWLPIGGQPRTYSRKRPALTVEIALLLKTWYYTILGCCSSHKDAIAVSQIRLHTQMMPENN